MSSRFQVGACLGSREKKLEDRSNRLADEEKGRMAIDRKEEKFQVEQRKKAVDKAKQQLYYETDRVRSLHVNSYYNQGVSVILRELVLPDGFDLMSHSFTVRDVITGLSRL
ncbi:unnamed protein product [Schistosoma curassoni]|uniref:Uncharacterized protein n=1 Tax=Schistosoma curassoni TaxID=6186 RepID=A0A3P8FXP1_9TREM|nr:unnamed protein product [Schistosoma curassoni]